MEINLKYHLYMQNCFKGAMAVFSKKWQQYKVYENSKNSFME